MQVGGRCVSDTINPLAHFRACLKVRRPFCRDTDLLASLRIPADAWRLDDSDQAVGQCHFVLGQHGRQTFDDVQPFGQADPEFQQEGVDLVDRRRPVAYHNATNREIGQLRQQLATRELFTKDHATLGILPMQMKAMLSKINTNESNRIHDDGLQKEKSPLSLPLVGIGLAISLSPELQGFFVFHASNGDTWKTNRFTGSTDHR